jgi:hypothetical protein
MNRTKSILLGATALAMFAAPQVASAQTAPGAAVVFLPAPTGATSSNTEVLSINDNGTVVVGKVGREFVRWVNGVPVFLGTLPNGERLYDFSFSGVASGDGSTVIGERERRNFGGGGGLDPGPNTYLWSSRTGFIDFPYSINSNEVVDGPYGLNYDGSVAILNTQETAGAVNVARAYRWTAVGGFQSLGSFSAPTDNPDYFGILATTISGDGNVIAGNTINQRFASVSGIDRDAQGAFIWTASGGLARLPFLFDSPSGGALLPYAEVNHVSRDGSTIVGSSRGTDGLSQAVYWRNGAISGLGFIPGTTPASAETRAFGASADGGVIVGGSANGLAWRWTSTTGMQDLNLIAANAGLNLNGFVLFSAGRTSDDGGSILGIAENAAQGQTLGFVMQLAQVTQSRLIVTIRLPGVTQTAIVNQTFNTQVDALLNGSTVFTRTVTDPITGAGGITALADARASLQQTSGLRRVVIGAPVLISNTTTVLGTTNAVVDVASGTATSTATVNTFGPATVATGNLGTCATAAANNTNPTGCSLAGTPVTVDAGILNSNVFTNTINSVTPTTTPTVNQLITAKWQVSAKAGNQFGTVHALTNVAAFDRGDRLIGQLLGMSGGQSSGSDNHVARAAVPMRDANGLGGGDSGGLTMFGGYFGNWSHIDADASVPVANVRGNTNGFVLGLEKRIGETARIGVAVDHGTSDYTVRDATYPETLAFKHTQVALFAGWNSGGFSLDGAASYGFGTARTLLTTPTTPATASRDVKSWSLGAQAGYTVPLGQSASVELLGGVRHVSANLNAFTEVGGPSPLLGRDQTVTRTRVYGGIEAQAGFGLGGITLTPRLHARVAHDSGDASGTADLVFVSAPNGPVMTAVGPGVGRDVAELGGSLDAAVGGSVDLWLGYDGTFRNGAQSHAAKAGLAVVF